MLCDEYKSVSTTGTIYIALKSNLSGRFLKVHRILTHPYKVLLFYNISLYTTKPLLLAATELGNSLVILSLPYSKTSSLYSLLFFLLFIQGLLFKLNMVKHENKKVMNERTVKTVVQS